MLTSSVAICKLYAILVDEYCVTVYILLNFKTPVYWHMIFGYCPFKKYCLNAIKSLDFLQLYIN